MGILSLILVLAAADADDGLAKKMLPIYVKEVEEYSLAVESAPRGAVAVFQRVSEKKRRFGSLPSLNSRASRPVLA